MANPNDPHYGARRVDFENAEKRMDAQNAQIAKDRELREKQVGDAEASSRRATGANTEARKASITVTTQQADSIAAVRQALELETAKLLENTKAWQASGRARAEATGAAQAETSAAAPGSSVRYPSRTVGFGNAGARLSEGSTELELRLAQQAALNRQANQVRAAASRYLESRGIALGGAPASSLANPAALAVANLKAGAAGGAAGAAASTAALSDEEQKLLTHQEQLVRSTRGIGAAQRDANLAFRESVAEVAASSQALTRHGALSTEFIQSFVRGEVTLQQFGASLTSTIGKFAGWAVAGGLVYGAFEALKRVADGAKETQAGVAQLERAIPNVNKKEAEEGFRRASLALNVPIKDVAQAQFFAARAGFHGQKESLQAGEIGVEALKLDEVPVQDATKALGAIRIAFGLTIDEVKKTFHELNQGQLEFNARLSQTLPQLGRASSAYANAGGNVRQLTRELVSVVGITGGGGGTGGGNPATFFIREPSNIAKASAIQGLRRLGLDPNKAQQDIGAFNEEIRKKYAQGAYSDEQVREIARFVGGGGGQGGRYGIANIVSGSGRQAEINKELEKQPSAGRAEDLGHKLHQLDEQFKQIGVTFEAVGSEIGKVGVTAAVEDVLKGLHAFAGGILFLAGPLDTIGNSINDFQNVPGLAPLLGVLGAAKIFTKISGATGLSSPLSEVPGLGRLDSESKKQLVGLKSTVNRGLEDNARELESETNAYKRATRSAQQQTAQHARYLESPQGRQGTALLETAKQTGRPDTSEEAQLHSQRVAAERQSIASANAQALARRENVVVLQQESLVLSKERALYAGPGSAQAKVQAGVSRYGAVVGPPSNATPLVGGAGYQGARREAELRQAGAAEETTIAAQAEAQALQQAAVATEEAASSGALTIKEALGAAGTQIGEGGAEVRLALQALVAEIRAGGIAGGAAGLGAAGRGVAGGLAASGGGVLGGLGALTSGIGSKLLGAFFKTYIFSAIAEVVGENIIGGNTGKKVAQIGGDAAVGAGIGTLLPIPGGTILGGLAGAAIGLLSGGSGSSDSAEKRLKEAKKRIAETQARIAAGLGGEGGADLEYASEQYAETLDEAFSGEGEAATKAKAAIEKANKAIAANLKIFSERTAQGRDALRQVEADISGAARKLTSNPTSDAAALYENVVNIGINQTKSEFTQGLKRATTPEGTDRLAQEAQGHLQRIYEAVPRSRQETERELNRTRQGIARDERFQLQLKAEHLEAVPLVDQRVKKEGEKAAALERALKRYGEAEAGLNAPANEAAEAVASEAFAHKQDLYKPAEARELAEAGPDPARRRAIERRNRERRASEGAKDLARAPVEAKKLREETETANIEAAHEARKEAAELIDRHATHAIAELPIGTPKAVIEQIKARAAGEKLRFERLHKAAFSSKEIEEAEVAQLEARKAAEEAALSEAKAIALAGAQGNALAQASIAAEFAKTPLERIEARNQRQQAEQARITAEGELAESGTTDPLAQDRIRKATTKKLLAGATPDEALKLRAQQNREGQKYTSDLISNKEQDIEFHRQMEQISTQTAISQYQSLLKLHGITKRERQSILEKIRALQKEETGGAGVYNLAPGTIKLPTALDVRRAIAGASAANTIIHSPTENHSAVNTFNITVRDNKDLNHVADVIDRATHGGVRVRLKAAGHRGH